MLSRLIIALILCLTIHTSILGQTQRRMVCAMMELTLEEKALASTAIIEGQVLTSTGFWNEAHTLIYTDHEVAVNKVFSGVISGNTVHIITQGGIVGFEKNTVHPALELSIGEKGIFYLEPALNAPSQAISGQDQYFQAYGDAQGFVRYDEIQGLATDLFHVYPEIVSGLYADIQKITGKPWEVRIPFTPQDDDLTQLSGKVSAISTFTPGTLSAGTASVLTINGSNFLAYDGGTNSVVFFRNANDGGASLVGCPASEIISWNNTQITLRVPNGAGTGTFVVRNSSGATSTSASSLTIDFNHTNVTFGGTQLRSNLRNKNGAGGYSFSRSTNTANSGVNFNTSAATLPFDNALLTWQCNTGFNFTDPGLTTTSNTQDPNTNPDIAMFDNAASPLSAGVLGVAISGFSSCDGVTWFVSGVDIVFRRNGTGGITWNFGPGATTGCCVDFESVAVHELGHAHQLGHIIAAGRIMHFSIGPGQDRRVLNPTSDIAGGNFVMTQSASLSACSGSISGMTPINCAFPLESLDLTGIAQPGTGNLLTWKSDFLPDFTRFGIEKSTNGIDFVQLDEIDGPIGNDKNLPVTWLDAHATHGVSWYRLQVLEPDGNSFYSETVEIDYAGTTDKEISLVIYPQPFRDALKIHFSEQIATPGTLQLFDLSGREVLQRAVPMNVNQLSWDCGSQLNAGMYMLVFKGENTQFATKVLKMN